MKRTLLAALALTAFSAGPLAAQEVPRRLYPGKAPGSENWTFPEIARQNPNGGTSYSNVSDPEITAHLVDPAKANGAAVILLPGGGLRALSLGQENKDLVRLFNEHGVQVFVLKYRTLQMEASEPRQSSAGPPMEFPKLELRNANANPSPGDARLSTVLRLAVQDAQTALRMVRAEAAKLHIDPKRIGFVGSSAGGGVAMGTLLAHAPGATPDFIISLYGPSLQEVTVPVDAPPLFIATETGHGPVTDGLLALFTLWKDAGKATELHVFDVQNFAMPVSLYSARIIAWLEKNAFLPSSR